MNVQINRSVLVIVICLGIFLSSLTQAAEYDGGDGSPETPYQIRTPEQMNTIGANPGDWGKHFKLTADLDMSAYTGTLYNIIGNFSTRFTGTFDGNGHVIRKLTIARPSEDFIGLFGYVGSGGQIRNLSIEEATITGHSIVGVLAGYNHGGSLTSCYAAGLVSGSVIVGGLVGHNHSGPLTFCYAAGSISGDSFVGGLMGYNNGGTLTSCYATGSVAGDSSVGGLVGGNYGPLTSCYAAGPVSGDSSVGGLVGSNDGGPLTACFWDIDTSGRTDGVGNPDPDPNGVTGQTTAQMKTLSTFAGAGWDFSASDGDPADWCLPYREYPRLTWEYPGSAESGTEEGVYPIWTPEQMNMIGANPGDWGKHFKLMADLDLSAYTGMEYHIIGTSWSNPFTGTFEGNGHVISHLTMTRLFEDHIGLFGYVWGGRIQNLGIENANIIGGNSVGGLVGFNDYGTLASCYAVGSVSGSANSVGGLVGYNHHGTLASCYANASVNGSSFVGGLVGYNYYGALTSCYAAGPVSGLSAGGLAGRNSGTITACFWDINTSGQPTSAGGTGKTTARMKTLSTFTEAGWDFVNTWGIGSRQSYPYLKSLTGFNPADMNYSGRVDLEDLAIVANNWLRE